MTRLDNEDCRFIRVGRDQKGGALVVSRALISRDTREFALSVLEQRKQPSETQKRTCTRN